MQKRLSRKKGFLEKLVEDIAQDLILAWLFMIFLGIAHGFDRRVPTVGYWTAFFLVWALSVPVSATIHSYKRWNKDAWK